MDDHDTMFYSCEKPSDGNVDNSQQPSLSNVIRLAKIHVINTFQNLADLHDHLNQLNLTDPDRLRPRWDTYFMVRFWGYIHMT